MAAPGGAAERPRAQGRAAGRNTGEQVPDGAARMPYEQARDELIELVRRLETGGLTLEESLQLWERGEELAAICEDWLEGARARLAAALGRQDQPSGGAGAPF
jgi:exodeoxyribonuclease VII small subunit